MDENENLEGRVMRKMGRLNYFATPWESLDEDKTTEQRRVSYKLSNRISLFATNVTCIQQKNVRDDGHALFIDEVLTLHDVPFGDNFQVHLLQYVL